jgi:alkanesulfonate monooxygenase SsuD/methylene tetrahydromethanopterin reductase-like flavin-dependent oxidoreductase (luciferase family)
MNKPNARRHSDVLADVWSSHDLAARFGEAMKRARVELGRGVNFTTIVARAWASDPSLRDQFGSAVSAGLKRMWASDVLRAAQSERIRKAYTPDLRRQRSEAARKRWAAAKAVPANDCDLRRRREMA